jgi:tetratricopeptide (TPR) repeat protein
MIEFEHIEYLWALVAVIPMIVFYYFTLNQKKKTIRKIGDVALVQQLIKDYSPKKFLLKFILIITAFVVGTIALANPRSPEGSTVINRSGIDVMIALDVSKSMLAQDIKPNRLEKAKQLISKLIDKLPNDRIGLVVFAGKAYLQMPLTIDHSAAKMFLSSITTDVVPTQGTVIGDALKMCATAFDSKEKKYKSIILISDGEDHDADAIKITKAVTDEGIMVNTVGIGSPDGATITDPETNEVKKDAEGNIVITKLNEDELKSIAENGNGIYQLFQSNNTDEVASTLNTQLKQMGQKAIHENSADSYENYFPFLLGITLLALLAEFFISEIKSRNASVKKLKPTTALLAILFFCNTRPFAQTTNQFIQKGNEAYNKKQYDEAINNYKKAIEKNPDDETAQYNLGNALYKSGKAKEAEEAFNNAIKNSQSSANKASAWYNNGVAFQNENKLPECINAYKQALRLNPDDDDARRNLQKALLKQRQQQQDKQDQNKQNNKNKQNKNQQKQQQDQQKQQDKQDQDQQNQQSNQQQPKMSKQDAEEKLKALMQQEKNLQDKMKRINAATTDKPEKDW